MALVLALAAVLAFPRLGERMLWGDEAETAVLALGVLEHGVPRVDVEGNRISLYGESDANEGGLWIWSPWLDEYVVAASLRVLGRDAFAARLPMVLAGLVTLTLLMQLARRTFGRTDVAIAAGVLLALSVPFLLHVRQSRYYALLMLGQVLQLNGFARAAAGSRHAGAALMAVGLAIQGHSNYAVVPGAMLALVSAATVERRRARGVLGASVVAVLVGLAAIVPWVLWAGAGHQTDLLALDQAWTGLVWYLGQIDRYVLPLVLAAGLPLLGWLACRRGNAPAAPARRPLESLLWLAVPAQLLVLSLSPQRYLRYLAPLFPLAALLAAVLLVRHVRWPAARLALLAVIATTNLLSLSGTVLADAAAWPASPVVHYLSSLASPYQDRTAAVVRRLLAEGAAGETVYVRDPEFPLIFHARVRVVDARLVRDPAAPPRWILPRSASGIHDAPLDLPASASASYERIEIEVPASRRGGGRPDPLQHEWRTARRVERFVLYRRRDGV